MEYNIKMDFRGNRLRRWEP